MFRSSRSLLQATAIAGALALLPIATGAMAAVDSDTYHELDLFMDVFNRVKADYVDKVDDKTLVHGAIEGMLAALDPHSSYEDALDYDNLKIQTEGNYGGLGLSVTMEDGAVKVIAPQQDTPAYRAGIKSGDFITNIDGQLVYGGTLNDAIKQMRGKPGTKINLTLIRPGVDKPINVTLTREVIVTKPVKWEVKGDVGYIDINTFSEQTGADTRAALAGIDKALGHRPLGYVVDLRDNGGGLLSQAVEVSDAFLDHGEIVSQRGRDPADVQSYYAKPGDDAHGLPVVVLTNAGTASASEIVAGALQDQHRALIMGDRTFGKGSVQTLIPLGPTSVIRLTTARYYTPSGHSVQEGGIRPDVSVPEISDPDYNDHLIFREADLRRHLINQVKSDDRIIEDDGKQDPRFSTKADELKKQNIGDFQLWYALKTIARLGGPTQIAAVTNAIQADTIKRLAEQPKDQKN
jgi:carboxyl-terminal processing protease